MLDMYLQLRYSLFMRLRQTRKLTNYKGFIMSVKMSKWKVKKSNLKFMIKVLGTKLTDDDTEIDIILGKNILEMKENMFERVDKEILEIDTSSNIPIKDDIPCPSTCSIEKDLAIKKRIAKLEKRKAWLNSL